ncbi:MAG TPA: PAS domain S-box protein [Phycisphaerales bacterium]|nr:PAS domain S-box protein [Phycisphaerales bacterium]
MRRWGNNTDVREAGARCTPLIFASAPAVVAATAPGPAPPGISDWASTVGAALAGLALVTLAVALTRWITYLTRDRAKTVAALRQSQERYRAFISNSTEGIYRIEFDPPIDTSLPTERVIDLVYERGRYAECNDAMARMYGLAGCDELVGRTLDFMLPPSDPAARAYLASIIEAGYRVSEVESAERDAAGNTVYFSNSMIADVEGGLLRRVWGTQRDISERKRVEEQRRASEERLRVFIEQAPAGLAMLDRNLRYIAASKQFLEDWGVTGEVVGRLHYEVFNDVPERWRPVHQRALAGEILRADEDPFERADGTTQWVRWEVRPWRDERGEIGGILIGAEDVSERVRAERRVHASEQQLRDVADVAPVWLVECDADGRYRFVNAPYAMRFGLRPDQVVGKHLSEVLGAAAYESIRAHVERVVGGERVEFEQEVPFDYATRRVHCVYVPRTDATGAVRSFVAVIQDVTAQHAAAAGLARLAAIVENSHDAIIAKDLNGVITSWNRAAEQIFGYTASEAIGRAVTILLPEERLEEEPMILDRIRRGETVEHYETVRRRKDGSLIDVSLTISPIRDAGGRLVGASKIARDVSARRRADQALRESEERLRNALAELEATYEQSPVGMVQLDRELRFVRINSALAAMNGLPPEAHIGRSIREIVPELAAQAEPAFRRVLETGEPVIGIELSGKTAADPGAVHTWLESWYPHRSSSGEIIGVNVVAQDITEHKRDADRLARSERANRLLAEVGAIATGDLDATQMVAAVCRRVGLEFGVTRCGYSRVDLDKRVIVTESDYHEGCGSIRGTLDFTAFAEHAREDGLAGRVSVVNDLSTDPRTAATYEQTFKLIGVRSHISVPLRRAGRWAASFWVSSAEARAWSPDEIDLMAALAHRVWLLVERADAIAALRESEAKYRAAFEVASVGQMQVDAATGRFTMVNDAFCRIAGRGREEMLSLTPSDITHPEDVAWDRPILEAFLRGKRHNYSVEKRYLRPDGSIAWVRVNAGMVFDSLGRPKHTVAVVEDVTARKLAEQELRLHREELQRLVAERTAELHASHERLRLSERMASIGTLSAGLGHDMGNLLMPLRVRLETLEAMGLPAEAARELDGIRTSAEYLRRLAAGLRLLALDPSGASAGEPTLIGAWWSETEPVYRNALPDGVVLRAEFVECDHVWAAVSRPALTQVVFNLVQNAGDAMRRQATGAVTVSARCVGKSLIVRVADNGPGMSDDVKRRCMEPFFTTKVRGVSTGLGLALVYGLVREAGGGIDLESTVGKGTTFTVTLPTAEPPQQPAAGADRRAFVDLKDPRMRGYVAAELKNLAYEVSFGTQGAADNDLVIVEEPPPHNVKGRVVVLAGRPKLSEVRAILFKAGAR